MDVVLCVLRGALLSCLLQGAMKYKQCEKLCATGCNSKDLGHIAGYSVTYNVKSPAFSDMCTLGRHGPHLFIITRQHHQSLARS